MYYYSRGFIRIEAGSTILLLFDSIYMHSAKLIHGRHFEYASKRIYVGLT